MQSPMVYLLVVHFVNKLHKFETYVIYELKTKAMFVVKFLKINDLIDFELSIFGKKKFFNFISHFFKLIILF